MVSHREVCRILSSQRVKILILAPFTRKQQQSTPRTNNNNNIEEEEDDDDQELGLLPCIERFGLFPSHASTFCVNSNKKKSVRMVTVATRTATGIR
mmetsp:Transcript_83001/g.239809  ORF Transcript_83001/g.239809 Transcript_83001/m.239809 type:complete len:96 (-) Transcript_83001:9-296(-)